jgi:hypothetical protein
MPFPGRIRLPIQIVQRPPFPYRTAGSSEKFRAIVVYREGIGGVGLQLDRVGAGFCDRLDRRFRCVKIPAVIRRYLGDDKYGISRVHPSPFS